MRAPLPRRSWLLAPVLLLACVAPPAPPPATEAPAPAAAAQAAGSDPAGTPAAGSAGDPADDPPAGPAAAASAAPAGPGTDGAPQDATGAPVVTGAEDEDDDEQDLLDMLLANGAITQEQYERLRANPHLIPGMAARPRIPAPIPEPDHDHPRIVLDESGLSIRADDGTRMDIGGRIQADASAADENSVAGEDITDGTELRRARIELKGQFREGWIWAWELDVANDNSSLKDVWVGHRWEDGNRVMLGNQKQPYSLSLEMSSNDIPFIERSAHTSLLFPFVDRAIGVRADLLAENWFGAFGIFGDGVDEALVDDEGWGLAGRLIHAPVHDDEHVVHLGVRGARRVPEDASKSTRIRYETTNMSNFFPVDTGTIEEVDHTVLMGAEAAFVSGPFSIIGAADRADIDRSGPDYTFYGWTVEAAYVLTGESRAAAYAMDAGEFKRIRPAREARGWDIFSGGAWELAARLSNLDANDRGLQGGEVDVVTVGANWYPTDFARFMLDVSTIVDTDGGTQATRDADGLTTVQARVQLTF